MEKTTDNYFSDRLAKLNKGGLYVPQIYNKRLAAFSFVAIVSLCFVFLCLFFLKDGVASLPAPLFIFVAGLFVSLEVLLVIITAILFDFVLFYIVKRGNRKRGERCFEASKKLYEILKSKGVAVSGHGSTKGDDGLDYAIRITLRGNEEAFEKDYLPKIDPASGFQVKYYYFP